MSEAIPGFTKMQAGQILLAATHHIDTRMREQAAWDKELPGLLVAWRQRLTWWQAFLEGYPPRNASPEALVKWYKKQHPWQEPAKGLPRRWDRPDSAPEMDAWQRRAKEMPPDAEVLVNVDDARLLFAWFSAYLRDRRSRVLGVTITNPGSGYTVPAAGPLPPADLPDTGSGAPWKD